MNSGSYFVFTVEELSSLDAVSCQPGREFKLMKSGRFGYTQKYLDHLINSHHSKYSIVSQKQMTSSLNILQIRKYY